MKIIIGTVEECIDVTQLAIGTQDPRLILLTLPENVR